MAGEGITFNDRKLKKFFKKIEKNVDEISDHGKVFWGALQAVALKDVINHFEKETGPKKKWAKWSDLYAAHMAKAGKSGNKILQDSGNLRQRIMNADSTTRIKQGQLLYNPAKTKGDFDYAKAHDEGRDTLPQREFMWLSKRALSRMSKVMAAHTLRDV